MGVGARAFRWPPCDWSGLRCERECVGVVCPPVLPPSETEEDQVRAVGLDVHLEFCEVAISEGGEVRSAGRIETKPERIELFAESLGAEDRVALEVTGNAWEIARLIEPHVARVVVVCPSDTGIRQARAKTDRLDARTLAKLLASGAGRGLGARSRDLGDASAPRAPGPAGLGTLTGEERDPRGADALPGRPRPVLGSVRGSRAGAGSETSSCPRRSARLSTRRCARSSSSIRRSPRSSG